MLVPRARVVPDYGSMAISFLKSNCGGVGVDSPIFVCSTVVSDCIVLRTQFGSTKY